MQVVKGTKFYIKITKVKNYPLLNDPYFQYVGHALIAMEEAKTIKEAMIFFKLNNIRLFGILQYLNARGQI